MGEQARARAEGRASKHTQYLKLVERMPALLRFVPNAGRLRDLKHYLYLFCYFLQPTPAQRHFDAALRAEALRRRRASRRT